MVDDPRFDIPPELRELVEKNVEQAQAAYGQFIDFLTQGSSMAPPNKMLPGLEAVRERAIEFAKENGERFFDLVSALARAKDIQEVLTLQGQYAQTQMQSYAVQAKELGGMLARVIPAYGRTIAIP
jgi:Phasin protein